MFSESDKETIYFFNAGASFLSVLGCIFIISVYLCFKQLRIFTFRLVIYLTIIDLLESIFFMIPNFNTESHSTQCLVQAVGLTYFCLADILMVGAIAYSINSAVIKEKDITKYEKYILGFVFGVPGAVAGLPSITGNYGTSQGWCWISQEHEIMEGYGGFWRLGLFYVPLWIVIVYCLFAYSGIISKIKSQLHLISEEPGLSSRILKKLMMYPLILIVCFLPLTAARIYEFFNPDDPYMWLTIVSGVFFSINGFLNAILYGFTDMVRKEIFKCCKQDKSYTTGSEVSSNYSLLFK